MPEFVPGLAGIPAAESAISFIDGKEGLLAYRGIRIEELAAKSTFEEVCYLLLYGSLPTRGQLDVFTGRLVEARQLPRGLTTLVRAFPKTAHPMDVLQTSVSALSMFGDPPDYTDAAVREQRAVEIIAKTPGIIGLFHRHREGLEVLPRDPALSHAADFLSMINGEKPDEITEHIMDVSLILHADHTMNASTFTARVTASTLSSPYSAISAAVGSLSGSLHGGANERVLIQLQGIGSKDRVKPAVQEMMEKKQKIMGLGHRVYSTKDPRATILQELANQLFEVKGKSSMYELAVELEEVTREDLGSRGIYPNVDFYSGIVYEKLGIPTDLFTPIFAVSRSAGWLAHWLEQMTDNKLYRPRQIYGGKYDLAYTDINSR